MDLPDLYLRKPHEEPYANMGKAEEQIKHLITRDKKFQKQKLRSDPSRDISHLKDQKKSLKKIPPLPLPTDISNLRSLMQTSNSRGIQIAVSPSGISHLTCTHKECIERVVSHNSSRRIFSKSSSRMIVSGANSPILEKFPLSEREPLGSPSGIQGIESLYEWFRVMKTQCEDEEATKLVYTMCARELLRQVSVQSTLRGKLLQEIIEMQPFVFGQQWEKLNNEFQAYKGEQEQFVQVLEKKYKEEMMRRDLELQGLLEKIRKIEIEKEEFVGLMETYKRALGNIQKKYLDSEDVWKTRMIKFVDQVKKSQGAGKKFNVLDVIRMRNFGNAEKDEEFKLFVESLSYVDDEGYESEEEFFKFKEQIIDEKLLKQEGKDKRRNTIFASDQSVQVCQEDFEKMKENSEKLIENKVSINENEIKLNENDLKTNQNLININELNLKTDENDLKVNELILNTQELEIPLVYIISPQVPLDPNETPQEIPTIFLESSVGSEIINEETENKPEIFIEEDIDLSNRINEAPSYAEESKDHFQNPEPENTFFNLSRRLQTPIDQITQTEDILFQNYLSKLSQIEGIISLARPEEIHQIQSSLQYLLQSDQSSEKNSPKKVVFKPLKRSSSDKLSVILEPIQKILARASPDINQSAISDGQKDIKQQVSEVVNSIHYLNSSILQKQQDLSNIERKIQQKSSILQVLSSKKVLNDSLISEHRKSGPILSDISRTLKSTRIKKKFSEKGELLNITPWDEGYEVGYGDGKIQGFLKALERIQETDMTDEIDTDDIEINESRPISKRKNSKGKIATRFMEFNFHVPTKNKVKKIHPGPMILEKFLNRSLERIKMRSTLSRKNLNRILAVIYNISVQRINSDNNSNLVIVTYDEFYGRYGLKSVCDKKFLEFVASIVSNSEYKRCLMYMRLIKYGELISSYSYSKYSLFLYLSCYQFIHSSKLGIHFSSDEDDKLMVPLLRVNECVKEKLEHLTDKSIMTSILSKIEQKSVLDPKKINVNGMVELELTLEIILDTYEAYISTIWKGLSLCLKAMGQQAKHSILNFDFFIICRFLNKPLKEVTKEVAVEDIYLSCIKFNLTREVEVLKLVPSLNKNELFGKLARNKETIFQHIENLKGLEDKYLTYEPSVWRLRFEILENYLDSDVFLSNLAWAMYEQELNRVFPSIFFE